MFRLHRKLAAETITVGFFPLSTLLLFNDANYPWFILVPRRKDVQEVYQLERKDQMQLIHESSHLAKQLARVFRAHKMNIAALGNSVPQLHVHHIVRYKNDPAWPAPAWGRVPPKSYTAEQVAQVIRKIDGQLSEGFSLSK
ncbi:MAG: HIT domain-containing protein [Planctomycetes bacterium]|nr:HIT domain-containing protein [Planctomycetota bacterium]